MVATRPASADRVEVRGLLLELGGALTMTGDAVSEIERALGAIAVAYGAPHAEISVLPTLLIVSLGDGAPAALVRIDSSRQLRLDQASEVIRLADEAKAGGLDPAGARARLREILASRPRFSDAARVAGHCALTVGLALLIRPAAVDLWVYVALGALVGALQVGAARLHMGGYLLPVLAAAVVSAIAFLAHPGDDTASLRLTIPPLVTFLPGGC